MDYPENTKIFLYSVDFEGDELLVQEFMKNVQLSFDYSDFLDKEEGMIWVQSEHKMIPFLDYIGYNYEGLPIGWYLCGYEDYLENRTVEECVKKHLFS